MQVMQFPLKILTVAGCRPPISWSSLCKRTVYNAYTILMCLLMLTLLLPQLIDIIVNVDNAEDFAETFYVMIALINACNKMISLLLNRKNIEILTKALVEKPFRPLEPDEIDIREKYNNMVRTFSIFYTILIVTTIGYMSLTSLLTDFRRGDLAYREWVPYAWSDTMYYITYFRQLISSVVGSILNLAGDVLICGLLLHIYCQIEILECRLKKSLRNQNDLGECVRLHDHIYKYARTMNENFKITIGVQFIASMLVVCFNLYRLAKTTLSVKYIPLISYTICMCMEILIYCWHGNEVKLKISEFFFRVKVHILISICELDFISTMKKIFFILLYLSTFSKSAHISNKKVWRYKHCLLSSIQFCDEIFAMDWVIADNKARKNLILIMNRSLIPIEFSSAHIVTVNLDSFVKLLQMSYSIFNLLKQTREE